MSNIVFVSVPVNASALSTVDRLKDVDPREKICSSASDSHITRVLGTRIAI
jgi:hypothetical protein